jgi:hypothetical protein
VRALLAASLIAPLARSFRCCHGASSLLQEIRRKPFQEPSNETNHHTNCQVRLSPLKFASDLWKCYVGRFSIVQLPEVILPSMQLYWK